MFKLNRWFKNKVNIRTRMLIMCFAIATPLILIGSYFLYGQFNTLKLEASNDAKFESFTVKRSVELWVESQLNAINALAGFKTLVSGDSQRIIKLFNTALKAQKSFDEIYLIDSTGKPLVAVSRTNNNFSVSSYGCIFDRFEFIKNSLKSNKAQLSDLVINPITNKYALMVSAKVEPDKTNSLAVVASINPKILKELYSNKDNNNCDTLIDLIDSNNRVVMRNQNSDYWLGKDFSQAVTVKNAKDRSNGVLETMGIADPIPRAYGFSRIANLNWLVVVGVPEVNIYSNSAYLLFLSLAGAVFAIALSSRISCMLTDYFTTNLLALLKGTRTISHGDLSSRVEIDGNDEFCLLAKSFNSMSSKLEQNYKLNFMLNKIADSIRQSLDLKNILNTTATELGQALEASRLCIALLDDYDYPNNTQLVFDYVYCNEKLGGLPLQNNTLSLDNDNLMNIIFSQKSILSMDVIDRSTADSLFSNINETYPDWRIVKSLIACPITDRNRVLGLILVQQCDKLRVWSQFEVDLVNAVSQHVSIAIQNAKLYEDAKANASQELLINHIVKSLRISFDLNTILNNVTREIVLSQDVDRCQIAQPTAEGPFTITHEFCKDDLTSSIGMNIYPNTIERRSRDHHFGRPSRVSAANSKILKNYVLGIDLSLFLNNSYETDSESNLDTYEQEITYSKINNVVEDQQARPFLEFLEANSTKSILTAGLISEGKLVGLLMLHQCSRIRKWTTKEKDFARNLADHIAIAITQAKLFAQVKFQAITDGMTGLYNHVYFKNRLNEEFKTAQRKGTHLSVIMIDLDKLKVINDTYGHPIGDAAIRQIASVLKTILRSGDSAARYGGEEFSVILPETTLLEAALIADRLCSQIRLQFVPGLGHISASLGVASYPKQANSIEDLIEKADKALYHAKNSGRDRACIYEESDETNQTSSI